MPAPPVAIREIDVATDDEGLHTVYLLMRDGYAADPVPFPLDPEPEATASLRALDPAFVTVGVFLATVEGEPAGMAAVGYPQRDNRESARLNHLVVHPGERRRGVGRALLDAVSADARRAGRTVLHADFRQVDNNSPSAGSAFAEAVGAVTVGRRLEQELDLAAISPSELKRLRQRAAAAPAAADCQLLRWEDRAPDDLVDAWARLRARMSTDSPVEDRPDEPEAWDADRVRDSERRYAALGRTQIVAAARHRPTGELVGYSYLSVARAEPDTAYQGDTLVVTGHRGHRLGLALKVDTLTRLRATSPTSRRMLTWNASTNTPMLAVNAALGYRVTCEECEVRLAL